MLLIHPPFTKACEPPAGITLLAGALRKHQQPCRLLDCNLEGLLYLLAHPTPAHDTWSKRAEKNIARNLSGLRTQSLFNHPDRYRKAVTELNRILINKGKQYGTALSLANFQESNLSPLKSRDLLKAAELHETNLFFPYFSNRLPELLSESPPSAIGFSLNYLSQAITCFAMIGFVKKIAPTLPVILGGSLITSWSRNSSWKNPFSNLVDHLIVGKGEIPLLKLTGTIHQHDHLPDLDDLPLKEYLAPGLILPYSTSSGCFWNKCSFCPEVAENNPYTLNTTKKVVEDVSELCQKYNPTLIHFLDNALSPLTMEALSDTPPIPWYGFARITSHLTNPEYCRNLRRSGCRMLKLGIESGSKKVLGAMNKGIDPKMASIALRTLHEAGIATYVYLLFGTPHETVEEAFKTMDFVENNYKAITFLNLAIFNLPLCSQETKELEVDPFYDGDLSLYNNFVHPHGWDRKAVRTFLDKTFCRRPKIAPILRRDPPLFTSNHASFFTFTNEQFPI